jgi:flagellar hook-length control protein FliK
MQQTEAQTLSSKDGQVSQLLSHDTGVQINSPNGFLTSLTTLAGDSKVSPGSLLVPQPLNHPKWGETFSERVVWMVGQDLKQADLRLNPPQLGPLEVKISFTNDQANITFSSQHASVREAVDAALPRLREMFAESGVVLQDANVSQDSNSDQRHSQSSVSDSDMGHSDGSESMIDHSVFGEEQVIGMTGRIDLYA